MAAVPLPGPSGAYGRAPASLSTTVRLCAGALIALLAVATAGAGCLVVFGLMLVVEDESSHTEELDGVGTWLGMGLGFIGTTAAVACGVLVHLLVSGWRRAARTGERTRLRRGALAAAVIGAVAAAANIYSIEVFLGSSGMALPIPSAIAVLGVIVFVALRRRDGGVG